jgi:hypothetical protein
LVGPVFIDGGKLLPNTAKLLDNSYGKNASMMMTWHKLMPTVMMMQEI